MNDQTYQQALYNESQRADRAIYDATVNGIAAAQSAADVAQRDYADAMARYDYVTAGEAQRRMARHEAELVRLETDKSALDETPTGRVPEQQQQPIRQYNTPMDMINDMRQLTPREREWLVQHQDVLRTVSGQKQLEAIWYESQERGIQRDSDEYFRLFNERLGGGSRGGNGRPRHPDMPKVSLTEAEAAKISGVSMEVYRENQDKLRKLKSMGLYGDR